MAPAGHPRAAPPPVQQSLIPDPEPVNPYLRTQPAQFDAPPAVQERKPAEAPAPVRTAAAGAQGAFTPVRVIESVQVDDGAVIYELFAEGRPDIWPAGDLAVQAGLHKLLDLPARPSEKATREMAEKWRPHRGATAIFTWHCYNNPAL